MLPAAGNIVPDGRECESRRQAGLLQPTGSGTIRNKKIINHFNQIDYEKK
ncbi:hypothetical protein HMPREF9141_2719 [Prevotella multiformis DSM 16608]|uniref:Uncharacterized protein n=1 Tax=Prevotella multiformis DSM 16608 TaxID=888743 RepID=F0FAV2_9BACT|nr:hypothetical protein HMPREF9141_2719 [Prevotella multiformis DSM 16608]